MIYLVFVMFLLQNQSQLIWGIKDKLKKFCSTNDMKELLIANGQEVPSGESNVRILFHCVCIQNEFSVHKEMYQRNSSTVY